jgi:hypothetical protein
MYKREGGYEEGYGLHSKREEKKKRKGREARNHFLAQRTPQNAKTVTFSRSFG